MAEHTSSGRSLQIFDASYAKLRPECSVDLFLMRQNMGPLVPLHQLDFYKSCTYDVHVKEKVLNIYDNHFVGTSELVHQYDSLKYRVMFNRQPVESLSSWSEVRVLDGIGNDSSKTVLDSKLSYILANCKFLLKKKWGEGGLDTVMNDPNEKGQACQTTYTVPSEIMYK